MTHEEYLEMNSKVREYVKLNTKKTKDRKSVV